MLSILLIVLPIFALILAGWGLRRLALVGPGAATELNNFVVYLALPALLFDVIVHARWHDIWQPGFILAFGTGCLLIFVATIAMAMRNGRDLQEAAVLALNGGYANTAFLGFPLTLAVFGRASQPLALIATIVTVIIMFGCALVLAELGTRAKGRSEHPLLTVTRSLAANPIILAPATGALFHASGLALPAPVETFLHLLGPVAPPTALVSIGLFIAGVQEKHVDHGRTVGLLAFTKLILQPTLTWAIGTAIGLPPQILHPAVLIAALPTGTGPFMLAKVYDRAASITSHTILVTTILSILTVTLYLWFAGIPHQGM